MRLGNGRGHGATEHPEEQCGYRSHLSGNEDNDPHGNEEQGPVQIEVLGEFGLHHGGPAEVRFTAARTETGQGEDDERNGDAGYRGPQHETDVREQVGARDGGGEVGRVRKGGELVAEVSTRDDGPCNPSFTEPQGLTDANEGDADRTDRSPTRTGGQAHGSAQDAGSGKEDLTGEDIESHVDQGRDDAGNQPCARQSTDEQQNEDGPDGVTEGLLDPAFEMCPGLSAHHADGDGDT